MKLSVIIPALNEAAQIESCVASAFRIGDEVIVVDGGSSDETASLAMGAGAKVIFSAKGRGPQLHAGALAASGDIFVFLHADSVLGPEARELIIAAFTDPEIVGGNFHVRFSGEHVMSRLLTQANDLRRRFIGTYYGDSVIFVRRETYFELGGFKAIPIMEDYDFARKLERAGKTKYIRETSVVASSRRFEKSPIRVLLLWGAMQGLYLAGCSGEKLGKFYSEAR